MATAAIYARYSSNLQSPTSIEDQERLLRQYATRNNYTVSEIFNDRAISGAVADRPGYQRMMQAAKRREFDTVIVEHQDRLWRDQAEMHAALKRLRFWGVRVLSVATGTDLTDPKTGRALATIAGLQAEMFLQDLSDKTRRGMEGQVSRGFSAGGRPYGYRLERHEDGEGKRKNSRLVIDEAEAQVVRRIFEMRKAGMTRRPIARKLNEEGVAPPWPKRGQKQRGWTPNTIEGDRRRLLGILNNPLYIGQIVWNRTRKDRNPDDPKKRIPRLRPQEEWLRLNAPGLRLVSDELWNAVKARQEEATRQSGGGRRNRRKHLFSGLVKCVCGAHYVKRDAVFYECADHRLRGPKICPNGRLVRRAVLEERLLQAIQDEILSPGNLAYLIRRVNESLQQANSRSTSERRTLEARLRDAEAKLENVKAAILDGVRTPSTKEMLEEWEGNVQRLRAELKTDPKAKATVRALPGLVESYIRDLRAVLGRDVERSRYLLQRLLGEIPLRPDGKGLVADLSAGLGVILEMAGVDSGGAGRGI